MCNECNAFVCVSRDLCFEIIIHQHSAFPLSLIPSLSLLPPHHSLFLLFLFRPSICSWWAPRQQKAERLPNGSVCITVGKAMARREMGSEVLEHVGLRCWTYFTLFVFHYKFQSFSFCLCERKCWSQFSSLSKMFSIHWMATSFIRCVLTVCCLCNSFNLFLYFLWTQKQ